jgi:putative copper export protein
MVGAGGLTSFDDAALLSADALFIISKRAVGAADADGAGRLDGQRLAGRLAAGYLAGGGRDAFGGVWVWQILLAFVALAVVWLKPRRPGRLLLVLFCAQLLLLAGVGHAAMNDGWLGIVQRTNHALHLFCVASWFGGLLPFIYCLRLAHGRWRQAPSAP